MMNSQPSNEHSNDATAMRLMRASGCVIYPVYRL